MNLSRYLPFASVLLLTAVLLLAGHLGSPRFWWPLVLLVPLAGVGIWNLAQPTHSIMRLYPLSAHVRWFFEWLRPYMREYLLDSDHEGRPFTHSQRRLVYQRSKDIEGVKSFGADVDMYEPGFEWINHSLHAVDDSPRDHRVLVGGADCQRPYEASVLNISAMSFGSLSGRAIEALNLGAKLGNFYHDTGEGGISRHHHSHGGDLVWEIGTGYFGCRTRDGRFDAAAFADRAAHDQVRMIEIKLSQGAKPGKGGMLPGSKVSREIAEARGVDMGRDVLSPARHSAFSTPLEMMEWIAELRRLSGGKPVGFKLCIGHRWEFLGLVKAMLQTGTTPDFIVVDGAEGGTGAAPAELSNHVGTPLREALIFTQNALVGTGLRDRVRVAAAGKIFDGHTMAASLSLGADWCNSGRAFMFALGCVQTKKCQTDRCPTGVATQDRLRQSGLVVSDKGPRVANFHRNTVAALSQYVAAAGLRSPSELRPHHLRIRVGETEVHSADRVYEFLEPGALIDAPEDTPYDRWWAMADASSFLPRS
ncbi:FMN-binding glutamate synthase family protein [Aquibium carbonis]|uniref:FMN-binding glutamate synthase family protein n=1 Tax=Aquibium carbonis TaxID=2495581 RepID=A0A429YZQ5_9HYPH|nr:FMN-binding glutamate synthase family protein [Aquibium carbonis]